MPSLRTLGIFLGLIMVLISGWALPRLVQAQPRSTLGVPVVRTAPSVTALALPPATASVPPCCSPVAVAATVLCDTAGQGSLVTSFAITNSCEAPVTTYGTRWIEWAPSDQGPWSVAGNAPFLNLIIAAGQTYTLTDTWPGPRPPAYTWYRARIEVDEVTGCWSRNVTTAPALYCYGATPTPPITGTPPSATPTPTASPTATATPTPWCAAGSWGTRTPYPTPIAIPAVVAFGGLLYSFGGVPPAGEIAQAEKYNPATDTWTAIAPLPDARAAAGVVTDGTAIYIIDGWRNNGPTNTLWRYDPVQNSYTVLAPSGTATSAPGVAYLNGRIYRVGGCTANLGNCPAATDTVEVYDIATDTWAAAAPYPRVGGFLAVTALRGALYAGGGQSAKTYRYDPAANSWDDAAIADLPGIVGNSANGVLNGRWIVAGGGPGGGFAVAWDPDANTWTLLAFPVLPRDYAGGGSMGQAFYLVGGLDPQLHWTADTQQYVEPFCAPRSPTPTVTETPTPPALTATPPSVTPPPLTPTPWPPTASATAAPASATVTAMPPVPTVTTLPPSRTVLSGSPTPAAATPTTCSLSFTDVQPADFFAVPVHDLACRGAISGYSNPDGTISFRPYNSTTRAQMVKIVLLGFQKPVVTPAGGDSTFADVPPSSPFYPVIETAAALNIVSGYTCGGPNEPCDSLRRPYFRPFAAVTRGQLSKIAVAAAGWSLVNPPGGSFADVLPGTAFSPFVEAAFCHGIISGYSCGSPGEPCDSSNRPYFRLYNPATRGQIAKIVDLAISPAGNCGGVTPPAWGG